MISCYRSSEEYCRTFDLTTRIPKSIVEGAIQKGELFFVAIDSTESNSLATTILLRLEELLKRDTAPFALPIRICIPSLGSPQWGDVKPQVSSIVHHGQKVGLTLPGNRKSSVSCISFGDSFANIHMHVHLYLYLLTYLQRTGAEQAGFRNYVFYRTQQSPWQLSQVNDFIN